MSHKKNIEELLNIKLNCNFEESIFKDIYTTLIWEDYYNHYDKTNGFFPEFINLDKKNLYLPYYLYYLGHRYVQIYFIMCDENPINGLIHTRIYEGQFDNIYTTTGYINEEYIELNEFCQNYLYWKELENLPKEHWKHQYYQKDNCVKAYNLVKYYSELLNINKKHFNDMNELCLILANIHININKYPPKENKYYCYDVIDDDIPIYYYINLETDKILCKEIEEDKEIIINFNEIGADYPYRENIFTPDIRIYKN